MKKLISIVLFALSLSVLGHEGHDTSSIKSRFGGVVKSSKNAFIEVVQSGKSLEIYLVEHSGKEIQKFDHVKLIAESKGKTQELKWQADGKKIIVSALPSDFRHFKLTVSFEANKKVESSVFNLETEQE